VQVGCAGAAPPQIRRGVARFQNWDPNNKIIGRKETWVVPEDVANRAESGANGNVRTLEKLLTLEPGTLGDSPWRVNIASPSGLRMSTGNEVGANPGWIPEGYTGGGLPEAVIDPVAPAMYSARRVFATECAK